MEADPLLGWLGMWVAAQSLPVLGFSDFQGSVIL